MKDKIFEVAKNRTENEETAMQLTNELWDLLGVSDSLPVACTMEDDKGELGWTRLSINYAGEVITNLSKKIKAFEDFIDSFNENYR